MRNPRKIFRCFVAVWAAVLLLSLMVGCSSGHVTLPALPEWREVPNGKVSGAEVSIEARRRFPAAVIYSADSDYTTVSHAWLERYLDWSWTAAKAAGVTYTPESFDCEDFAIGFHFFAARAAAKARVEASPLVARIIVEVPGGRHAMVGVATDRGLFIIEPQPDAGPFRIQPLDTYPNRILAITFGEVNP